MKDEASVWWICTKYEFMALFKGLSLIFSHVRICIQSQQLQSAESYVGKPPLTIEALNNSTNHDSFMFSVLF